MAALGRRVVLGPGAFDKHRLPAFMPCVERLATSDSVAGLVDAGEHVGETFELSALLESGFGRQVDAVVPLHVDEAALDARRSRPRHRRCLCL